MEEIPSKPITTEDRKQLLRSAGSVGANYIEANDGVSRKDFILRIRISRKEVKESRYWLRLLQVGEEDLHREKTEKLIQEAEELAKIFGAILKKCEIPNEKIK